MKFLKAVILIVLIGSIGWFIYKKMSLIKTVESKHQLLVERIEAMGKLELVKYRFSDVLEHKISSTFLPDASVLLIVKADAVGCVDLTKLTATDIQVIGDSVTIQLPKPEVCYVKIDHKSSRVYDTKMAFFREADLVGDAFKAAEIEITKQVSKSDLLQQTQVNAMHVFKPLLQGLGYSKISISFD